MLPPLVAHHPQDTLVEEQHPHQTELGEGLSVDTARGGDDGLRHPPVVSHAFDELTDPRAGGLNPSHVGREIREVLPVGEVEIEEYVGLSQELPPPLFLLG